MNGPGLFDFLLLFHEIKYKKDFIYLSTENYYKGRS